MSIKPGEDVEKEQESDIADEDNDEASTNVLFYLYNTNTMYLNM